MWGCVSPNRSVVVVVERDTHFKRQLLTCPVGWVVVSMVGFLSREECEEGGPPAEGLSAEVER